MSQRIPVLAAVAAALSIFLVGCSLAFPAESTSTVPPTLYEPEVAAAESNLGVCPDGSPSNDLDQVVAGLDQVASSVRGVPAVSAESREARDPVAGIHVIVRQVSASSFSSVDDELLDVLIPAVPGLIPPPDPAEYETYADQNRVWRESAAAIEGVAADAEAARVELLAELAELTPAEGGSDVAGCLTALRDSFPPDADVIAVLISDLEQVGPPQIRGDYSRVNVVVAHTCQSVDKCEQTESEWQPVLESMGVASYRFLPVGQLAYQLDELMEVHR